jgi:trehalose/maltose transport system substrate-binding protein
MTSRPEARLLAGRRINRRDFLKMSGAGLAGAALLGAAGCGGGGAGSGQLIFSMGSPVPTYTDLIDKFNKQNKGEVEATLREMPANATTHYDKLTTEFQAGGGDIDVIGGDVIWAIQFAAQGYIQDLSDDFPESEQKKFLPGPLSAMEYEGGVYGIPWFTDAGMIYYRKDLLEQAGFSAPPETWDELKEMALKTAQDTGTKNGFVFQGMNYEGGVCNGCEYIWTHGGEVLSGVTSGKVVIDSPEALAAMETYRSMVADGVAPEAVANYDETTSVPVFGEGDAVFMRDWPGDYALFGLPSKEGGYPNVKPEQVGIAPIPVAEPGMRSWSTLGGWNQFVNAQTDLMEEAVAFAQFMTEPEQEKFLGTDGGLRPTRKALYEDPAVLDALPGLRLQKDIILNNAKSRPVTEFYGDMSLELAEQFNNVLTGDTSPQEAVETLQKDLSSIMQQAE